MSMHARRWVAIGGAAVACGAVGLAATGHGRAEATQTDAATPTVLHYTGETTVQTSDSLGVRAVLVESGSGTPVSGETIQFVLGADSVSATTNAQGIAAASLRVRGEPGSTQVTATFDGDRKEGPSSTTEDVKVAREDAELRYTGDLQGATGSRASLVVTVLDSAAAGYGGPQPEPGGTVGDITQMSVRIVASSSNDCNAKKSLLTTVVDVVDSGARGDGIGTATATLPLGDADVLCLTATLVDPTGGENAWYSANEARPVGLVVRPKGGGGPVLVGVGTVDDFSAGSANVAVLATRAKKTKRVLYSYREAYYDRSADYVIYCDGKPTFSGSD